MVGYKEHNSKSEFGKNLSGSDESGPKSRSDETVSMVKKWFKITRRRELDTGSLLDQCSKYDPNLNQSRTTSTISPHFIIRNRKLKKAVLNLTRPTPRPSKCCFSTVTMCRFLDPQTNKTKYNRN